jgi:hypothetical protein
MIVSTMANATVPGRVSRVVVVELDGSYVEVQWNAVADTGGSAVLKYQLYLNGFLAGETSDGRTLSLAIEQIPVGSALTLAVRAVNAVDAGPPTELVLGQGYDTDEPPAPHALVPTLVRAGAAMRGQCRRRGATNRARSRAGLRY